MGLDFSVFLSLESWLALGTLSFLEIILGIDNLLFISLISQKLPDQKQDKARVLGLILALLFRLLMLSLLSWIAHFQEPLFELMGQSFSGRNVVLFCGGVFLLVKTIGEIHEKTTKKPRAQTSRKKMSFGSAVALIVMIDLVFSLDSILTAVGMVSELAIMVSAVVLSMIVMIIFVNRISRFILKHPSIQMLALSFLILIAFILILDGLNQHIDRAYVYFALCFALLVEFLNLRSQKSADTQEI